MNREELIYVITTVGKILSGYAVIEALLDKKEEESAYTKAQRMYKKAHESALKKIKESEELLSVS